MKAKLIIVNGKPGAGKSTLAQKLAIDLKIPCLHKDGLKEYLFDTLGTGDREWSRTLGAPVSDMLYLVAEAMARGGHTIMIEMPSTGILLHPNWRRSSKSTVLIVWSSIAR